jgi:hypothetical protein
MRQFTRLQLTQRIKQPVDLIQARTTHAGHPNGRREFDPRAWPDSSCGGIQPLIDGLAASWSYQVRAHPVEQKGSPFLTASSGRLPRQFTHRRSPRWGGSAGSEGGSPNLKRVFSARFL